MNINQFLTIALALVVGGAVSVTFAYFLIKNDIENYFRFKSLDVNKDTSSSLLPLRLQAHERLILFVERINPSNLLVRLHQKGIDLSALQVLVINDINAEYQHNITQQLYINSTTWTVVKKLKDDTIAMINNVGKNLPGESAGIELSKNVLQHLSEVTDNPYDLTIGLIKQDVHKMF